MTALLTEYVKPNERGGYKMIVAKCIACNHDIVLARGSKKWTYVTCQCCGKKLEIIQINPPLLDWPLTEVDDILDDYYDSYQETIS